MSSRKTSKRKQTESASKGGKLPVTVRLDVELVRTLDRLADLRGSSRSQMLQQAIEFYTWMAQGGAAVQMFEPWKDPELLTGPTSPDIPATVKTPSRAEETGPDARPPVERAGRRIDESESLRASQNSDDSVPAGLPRETDPASFRATG